MKKLVTIFLAMVCAVTLLFPVSASAPSIMPLWDNADEAKATISFNGTDATVTTTIEGDLGTTNITANVAVYYQSTSGSWVKTIYEWNYDVNARDLNVSETFAAFSGRQYAVMLTAIVTKNGVAEEVSHIAKMVCP